MRVLGFLLLFFSLNFVEARPFEDQILPPPPKVKGVRILRNKNVTFTNEQPEERGGSGLVKTLFSVKGRSRPDRTGKVLSQIPSQSIVTPFKLSRNKKWVAVIVRSSGVRAWVPKSALPKLDAKFRLVKKADEE
ncbi:MAG: hypothetical protein R3A80_04915 [Bdellovibrionota bacterium]